jgi:hypothetical protein
MMSSLGGFYLPAGNAPRYYSESAPLPYKIACEIAPVIEDLVVRHGDDLAPHPPQAPVVGAPPAWAQTVTQFNALTMALQGTGKNAAEAYAYFSSQPDPRLKLVGIQGRMETGDASALLDLETNLTAVAPALKLGFRPMTSMGIDVRANLPAAHALGRLAIGETSLPGIEGGAASQLASTHSPEFLPYLIVMLGSPSPSTRDLALMSFCQLLRDQKFWTAEMLGYCPNRSPLNDPTTEQNDIPSGKSGGRLIALRSRRPSPCPMSPRPRATTSRTIRAGNRLRSRWRSDSCRCSTWPAVTPTITTMPAAHWCKAPDPARTTRSHHNSHPPIAIPTNKSALP